MQLTLSSKGQLVIPAPIRRKYRLRARSKIELEERDGGLFIRPAGRQASAIPPIEYLPPGAIQYSRRDYAMMEHAAVEIGPEDIEAP
ncbi:MAG TPA: AbrB/MazE/SpoVT family DNA-binding domain-containing protein [Opitutaceae bacterium]